MAVTAEPKAGTITEVEGRAKVTPETEVKTPAEEKVSPEEEPRIFTQKQADALIHAKDSEWGRKYKPVEVERDKFKSELEANAEDIKDLEKKLEDMSSDDPARFDAVKELKATRDERRQLKAERQTLESEKKEVKAGQDTMREIAIWEIASEYQGADPVILKSLCETLNEGNDKPITEEQIRKAAATIWAKATVEQTKPKAPIPYTGKPSGSGPESLESLLKKDTRFMSQKQLAELKAKLIEAQKAH